MKIVYQAQARARNKKKKPAKTKKKKSANSKTDGFSSPSSMGCPNDFPTSPTLISEKSPCENRNELSRKPPRNSELEARRPSSMVGRRRKTPTNNFESGGWSLRISRLLCEPRAVRDSALPFPSFNSGDNVHHFTQPSRKWEPSENFMGTRYVVARFDQGALQCIRGKNPIYTPHKKSTTPNPRTTFRNNARHRTTPAKLDDSKNLKNTAPSKTPGWASKPSVNNSIRPRPPIASKAIGSANSATNC